MDRICALTGIAHRVAAEESPFRDWHGFGENRIIPENNYGRRARMLVLREGRSRKALCLQVCEVWPCTGLLARFHTICVEVLRSSVRQRSIPKSLRPAWRSLRP